MSLSHDHLLVKRIKQRLSEQRKQRLKGLLGAQEEEAEREEEAYDDEDGNEEGVDREKEEYDEQGRLLSLSLRDEGLTQLPSRNLGMHLPAKARFRRQST